MDKAVDNPEQHPGAAPEEGHSAPPDVAAPDVTGAPGPAPAPPPTAEVPAAAQPAKGSAVDERAAAERAGGAPVAAAEPDSKALAGAESQTAVAAAVPAEPVRDEAAPVAAEPVTSGKPHKRVLTGTVVSNRSEQSVVIRIAHRKKHRLYKKYRTLTKKVMAHDPANDCRIGDLVRVVESRPLSKMKRWRLVEIVKRAS